MTEPLPPAELRSAGSEALVAVLAGTRSDPAGTDTFVSYLWQAKQAVRMWLTCLLPDGPQLVACEHVEDLTAVSQDGFRFCQLKTRGRGSWSALSMCDDGLDSLCRSYASAKGAGVVEDSFFELWLEGPIASKPDTVKFVADPSSATVAIRNKLQNNGAETEWLDDFLSRLSIQCDQPARSFIDAIVIREISCIWPALSKPDLDALYIIFVFYRRQRRHKAPEIIRHL
jgi:Cap4 dsDNA endonuclease